jgi:hypothetical protein
MQPYQQPVRGGPDVSRLGAGRRVFAGVTVAIGLALAAVGLFVLPWSTRLDTQGYARLDDVQKVADLGPIDSQHFNIWTDAYLTIWAYLLPVLLAITVVCVVPTRRVPRIIAGAVLLVITALLVAIVGLAAHTWIDTGFASTTDELETPLDYVMASVYLTVWPTLVGTAAIQQLRGRPARAVLYAAVTIILVTVLHLSAVVDFFREPVKADPIFGAWVPAIGFAIAAAGALTVWIERRRLRAVPTGSYSEPPPMWHQPHP